MKHIFLTCSALLLLTLGAAAQSYSTFESSRPKSQQWRNLWALSWEISVPSSNDFISSTSLAGGRFDYRYFLPGKPVSFGVALSWNSYEQYVPTRTVKYNSGESAITTDFNNVLYTVPVTATAHYYFNYGRMAMPYIGVGIGAQYAESDIYYNIFLDEETNWGFCVRPEIGLLVSPGMKNWGILANVGYNFATNKIDLTGQDNLKSVNFNIGLFLTH
ncbi:outer membrane beta-barrel protein [Chitinophaga lutea]